MPSRLHATTYYRDADYVVNSTTSGSVSSVGKWTRCFCILIQDVLTNGTASGFGYYTYTGSSAPLQVLIHRT